MSRAPTETTGLVLNVQPYSESSQLIYALTERGRLNFLARGAMRKTSQLGGPAEILHYARFRYADSRNPEGRLNNLRAYEALAWFERPRRESHVFVATEMLREVLLATPTPATEASGRMALALKALKSLEEGAGVYPVATRFLARLLRLLGLEPDLRTSGALPAGQAWKFHLMHGRIVGYARGASRFTALLSATDLDLVRQCFRVEAASGQRFPRDAWCRGLAFSLRLMETALGREVIAGRTLRDLSQTLLESAGMRVTSTARTKSD